MSRWCYLTIFSVLRNALFNPVRRRLQDLIDRRKYDAAKILAAFSASSREEVDLTRLGERLVSVVEETMQPTHVCLWLTPNSAEVERTGYRIASCFLNVTGKHVI